MIGIAKREKLSRFLSDEVMATAVFEVLMDTYTKPRAKLDVHTLAGERIAINLLQDAWRELQKFKHESGRTQDVVPQVGL